MSGRGRTVQFIVLLAVLTTVAVTLFMVRPSARAPAAAGGQAPLVGALSKPSPGRSGTPARR